MSKIVVVEFLTLDGVMQAPGNPDEDRSGGVGKSGWEFGSFDGGAGDAGVGGAGQATRISPRPKDVRHVRGPLAESARRGSARGDVQRPAQVRRVDDAHR